MSDYVECLVAAGIVQAGENDEDYQEYKSASTCPVDYDDWQELTAEWNRLDDRYKSEYEPFYDQYYDGPEMTATQEREAKRLIDEMVAIEIALGF